MPVYRRCTPSEAETIRRDVARLGARAVAAHLSALALADGRTPVGRAWVTDRAHALGVPLRVNTARRAERADARAAEAGRLHVAGVPTGEIARRLRRPTSTVGYQLRRFYDALGVAPDVWRRQGAQARPSAAAGRVSTLPPAAPAA